MKYSLTRGIGKQYDENVIIYPGVFYPKNMQGKRIEIVEKRQRRTCEKCDKVQDELID